MLVFFDVLFIFFLCYCLLASLQGKFKVLAFVLVCIVPFHVYFYNSFFSNSPVSNHFTSWKELCVLFFVLASFLFAKKGGFISEIKLRKYDWIILVYTLFQLVYLFKTPSIKVGLYGFLLNCSGFIAFLATPFLKFEAKQLKWLIGALLVIAVIPGIVGIYEFYFANKLLFVNKDTEVEVFYREATNKVRAGSVFSSFLVFSFYLVLPFSFTVSRFIYDKKFRKSLIGMVALVFFVLAYLSPQTRSIIVFILCSVILFVIFSIKNKRTKAFLIVAMAVIAISVIGNVVYYLFQFDESSSLVRLLAWNNCYECMMDHKMGLGLGTAGVISDNLQNDLPLGRINCESWLLQMGVEMGLLGIVLYVAFVVFTLIEMQRLTRLIYPSNDYWMLFGVKVIFLTMTLSGLTLHSWAYPATIPFFLLFGLVRTNIINNTTIRNV